MNVLCLHCDGMQQGAERRGCGVTEWICLRCGRVAEVDFDDDDIDIGPHTSIDGWGEDDLP
jgi:hypothetical protein